MRFKVYYTIAGFFTLDVKTREDADAVVENMTAYGLLGMSDHVLSAETEIEEVSVEERP